MRKAAVEIPRDYLTALQQITTEEEAGLSCFVLGDHVGKLRGR